MAAAAGGRPRRPTVDEVRFPQNLLLSMVARWQEPSLGARRFSFGSGIDSEFSKEVVRTRFGRLRTSCLPYGNYPESALSGARVREESAHEHDEKSVVPHVVVGVRDQDTEHHPPRQRLHVGFRRCAVLSQCVDEFHIAARLIVFRSDHAHC